MARLSVDLERPLGFTYGEQKSAHAGGSAAQCYTLAFFLIVGYGYA